MSNIVSKDRNLTYKYEYVHFLKQTTMQSLDLEYLTAMVTLVSL